MVPTMAVWQTVNKQVQDVVLLQSNREAPLLIFTEQLQLVRRQPVLKKHHPLTKTFQVWADNWTVTRRYEKTQDAPIPTVTTTVNAIF